MNGPIAEISKKILKILLFGRAGQEFPVGGLGTHVAGHAGTVTVEIPEDIALGKRKEGRLRGNEERENSARVSRAMPAQA